jgi:hypothetical protein
MVAIERASRAAKSKPTTDDNGLRKITVEVAVRDLESAQALTGKGVTETVRIGLKQLASVGAQRELLKYQGKVDLGMSWEEMKYDRE